MAEASKRQSVFVTGGAEGVGLAAVKALLRRGHQVMATACDADGALAIRQAGALPVYPDLARASELLSVMNMARVDAVVHCGPQYYGGPPQTSLEGSQDAQQLVAVTEALVQAAVERGVKRMISLSFGYLYEAGHGAAKEGDHDVHDSEYAPMLAAEAAVWNSGLSGAIIRSGYVYGGNSPATRVLADMIKASRRLPAGGKPASWIHEDDLASAMVALLEAEADDGMETVNAADGAPRSPDEFAAAACAALGLNAPAFASAGPLAGLRQKTLSDRLLGRDIVISSEALKARAGWQPKHSDIESGLAATALVWRMKDAVDADDFYNDYEDEAAQAIASFAYEVAAPEVEAAVEAPAQAQAPAPSAPEPQAQAQAASPPPSAGPTPWNEDDAKREERRRRALERKAKRAAKQAGG